MSIRVGPGIATVIALWWFRNKFVKSLPPRATNHTYEKEDCTMTFFFKNASDIRKNRNNIYQIIKPTSQLPTACNVKFYTGILDEDNVICLKGQRRLKRPLPLTEFDRRRLLVEVTNFFQDKSSEERDNHRKVSFNRFKEEVIQRSSKKFPVIVQVSEKSCFLCFLLHPFIESVRRVFDKHNIPAALKTVFIDENDFPPGMPVSRATPAFIEYRGNKSVIPWPEFRPNELVEALSKRLNLKSSIVEELTALTAKVQERMERFGLLTLLLHEKEALMLLIDGQQNLPPCDKEWAARYHDLVERMILAESQNDKDLDESIFLLDTAIADVQEELKNLYLKVDPQLRTKFTDYYPLVSKMMITN